MLANEDRIIFGTVINYLPDDNHFVIAVDNDDNDYKEIISIDLWEIERYYPVNPQLLLNHRIYCEGTQTFDDNNSKWLTELNTLEILVDVIDYLKLSLKDEEKTEPCI